MSLPPTSARVMCGEQWHRLEWTPTGGLMAPDHAEPSRERALAALGGEPTRCIQLVDRWARYATDLDVLIAASRTPSGLLPDPQGGRPLHHPHRRGGGGWFAYSPLTSHSVDDAAVAPPPTLGDLLRLPGGLPLRLQTEVVTSWLARPASDPAVVAAQPRLHAALYGRFAGAVRSWLGRPDASVSVEVADEPSVTWTEDGVQAALPLSWLLDVWAPGLAVVLDRLTLSVTSDSVPERLTVVGVGRDLAVSSIVMMLPTAVR